MTNQILIVEDDRPTRDMYRVALEMKGLQVHSVSDGEGAIRLLETGYLPAVILVDWRMPVMNGKRFCDMVQRSEPLRKIPLLVVSASANDVPCEIPSLAKPFELQQLYSKINQTVGYPLID